MILRLFYWSADGESTSKQLWYQNMIEGLIFVNESVLCKINMLAAWRKECIMMILLNSWKQRPYSVFPWLSFCGYNRFAYTCFGYHSPDYAHVAAQHVILQSNISAEILATVHSFTIWLVLWCNTDGLFEIGSFGVLEVVQRQEYPMYHRHWVT